MCLPVRSKDLLCAGSASFLTGHAAVIPALVRHLAALPGIAWLTRFLVVSQVQRGPEPSNHGWSQHTAPEGYQYYYNSHTGVSQWERPMELDFPLTTR